MPLDFDRPDEKGEPLRIFQVMPREMYFGASRATSIDLCVRDLMSASRHKQDLTVFCEPIEDPFTEFAITHLPATQRAATFARANFIATEARRLRPDVIIVQQHLPTAAAIALRLPQTKIVLHTHNFQKTYDQGAGPREWLRKAARKYRYQRLAGIIHVSQACKSAFARGWPDLGVPDCVVSNALDFDLWRPAEQRKCEIFYAGRCAPEKGVIELAQAAAVTLRQHPDWRARFMLSAVDAHPVLFNDLRALLAPLGEQAEILVQQPFEKVKAGFETAAIAVVPSTWIEPFGRTALEAHAGGAALVSSMTGGLAEVSGSCALDLPGVSPDMIAQALSTLITNNELRDRLAKDGAQRVRSRFTVESQAAVFDRFCSGIHDGDRSPPVQLEAGATGP